MKTLKLFNAVISKNSPEKAFVSDLGLIIEPNAVWAKNEILDYYIEEKLSGNDLNKTFHKSWEVIKNSSRFELLIKQILHYISTYGSDFKDEIYIPNELLEIPEIQLKYKVIKAYTKDEMIQKCLKLLKSGIAMSEETIDDVIDVLVNQLKYKFDGSENIKNKEAIVKIADRFNVFPNNTTEFFRYIIFKTTETTLLIKSKEVINQIKDSNFNPSAKFEEYGLEKLAEIFNRFKPLFLAFKNKCPKTINKISKLSKKYHKPLTSNPLNQVTYRKLSVIDTHWLDNATPYALFKALTACYNRNKGQNVFIYRIRNGKSWVQEKETNKVNDYNYKFILDYIKTRFNLENKKFYIPKDVEYAIPTSEKMFVGNIPTGTKFYGKKLAVGIYWENSWGANDLDLSAININGKVGWNQNYNQNGGKLMYSGDITSAPEGAVEYLYANKGLKLPSLVMNNVYSGKLNSTFKIIIGKGDKVTNKYMMNPNNLFLDIKTTSVQKQTLLGIFLPDNENNKQSFVLLNFGSGNNNVSFNNKINMMKNYALVQEWTEPIKLKDLLIHLGAEIVEDKNDADVNLELNTIQKDTFVDIFTENIKNEILV